ncbi:DUF2851 family protein [Leeuwenhoekiella parthenopeia]|uniref:DUF2851 family protein n=1 Tax=Leeuwenhoekiella parthenopeia TaxID=2890320 RepID=A0ABS8GZN2_9FLAO|nr:DUF2851 family protein [Leeuwenhoekiella parthenopeia]MCC4214013.1 DUF2851 family protein [Leeuwenhoekiella parthenopeia]
MNEAFLHYLWKFLKFEDATSEYGLFTTTGQTIQILKPGMRNQLAGPDFFNAQLRLDGQLWAGNVEIHLKSSDWYLHNHEQDEAYANVILHVVWEDDCAVFDKANQPIPTLALSGRVPQKLLYSYKNLLKRDQKRFINCETDFGEIPASVFEPWLERVYFERLERKVLGVEAQLDELQGDWEAVLFVRLARSFGTLVNAEAFEELARGIPFTVVRKLSTAPGLLEPVLLGLAGLLPEETQEAAVRKWKQDFEFARTKFNLSPGLNHQMQFFKLRPPNFPTLRLSQLAAIYEQSPNLFEVCVQTSEREVFQKILGVKASAYWETHYTFGKPHAARAKKLTAGFTDILLINTLIPVKFAYARSRGLEIEEDLLSLLTQIPLEQNSLVAGFETLRKFDKDALHSQALIQLKQQYCDPNKCLHCGLGNFLLSAGHK